ncbi:MAG: cytochrome c peroxidase [Myxococcota bacterium]
MELLDDRRTGKAGADPGRVRPVGGAGHRRPGPGHGAARSHPARVLDRRARADSERLQQLVPLPRRPGERPADTPARVGRRRPEPASHGEEPGRVGTASLAARPARPGRASPPGAAPLPEGPGAAITRARIDLGRKLFLDRRLSRNGTLSCAMCHIPRQGFTSHEVATAVGIEGRTLRRNAPTLYNVGYARHLFHDGREARLERQIWGPLLAANEMGNPSVESVVGRLTDLTDYAGLFERAFAGRGPSMQTLGAALASYERALLSGNSPFDRWYFGGDRDALSQASVRGFRLFSGRAGCDTCHRIGEKSALFTDHQLHNTGIGYRQAKGEPRPVRHVTLAPGESVEVDSATLQTLSEPLPSDLGLYEVTKDPRDRWKYKTPSLRNVALTAPYMHDGSLATLREVVEFYAAGGAPNPTLDPGIHPLELASRDIDDLVAFLESLTGDDADLLALDAEAAPVGDPR